MDKVSKQHILLVDDEPKVLSALRRTLRSQNYIIETFERPKDAIAYAKTQSIDLIVSDYRMPDINGVSLLKELKAIQPNMIMIMLSGYVDMPAVLAAINEVGIYKYLTKPWKDDELQKIIKDALKTPMHAESSSDAIIDNVSLPEASGALALLEHKYPGITKGVWNDPQDKWSKIRR